MRCSLGLVRGNHLGSIAVLAFAAMVGCGTEEGSSVGTGGAGGASGAGGTGGSGGCAPCTEDGAELADNGCDDNCDGFVDEVISCDSSLTLDTATAVDAVRAMEICRPAMTELDWGVTATSYSLPAGESPPSGQMSAFDLGHGMLTAFGSSVPRGGLHMLALSSGTARDVGDPGYQSPAGFDKGYLSAHPDGFPTTVPACAGVNLGDPHDGIALSVELRVPPNASAFAFDFAFYTSDFSDLVCSDFSDVFAVFLGPGSQQAAGNLPMDDAGNPISVNSTFLDACGCDGGPPCESGGLTFDCSLGESLLEGTGYEGAGGTGWLTTIVPTVSGIEIQLTFALWDSGDGVFDSTVLIDSFRWVEHEGGVATFPSTP